MRELLFGQDGLKVSKDHLGEGVAVTVAPAPTCCQAAPRSGLN